MKKGRVSGIESVGDFASRVGLAGNTPNSGTPDLDFELARSVLSPAVDAFQSHLVEHQKERELGIEKTLNATLNRLAGFEARFRKQLDLKFADVPADNAAMTASQRRQKTRRQNRAAEIDQLFEDWTSWYDRTRRMVKDPNPFVEIKAVFVG